MAKKEKYTITLDDDPAVPKLIAGFTQLNSVAFHDAEELFKQSAELDPIAIFVDVHLAGTGMGIEYIPQLRVSWPHAAILVVTADPEPDLVGRALTLGANDFLRKPFSRAELVGRLKARLCEMSLRFSADSIDLGRGRFNIRKRLIEGPAETVYLSPLQGELLRILLDSEGQLIPKEIVKKAIWGKISVTDNALDRRLSELRRILRDSGVDMRLISEYGRGISLQRQHSVHPESPKLRQVPA